MSNIIYGLCDPIDNTLRYIGYTCDPIARFYEHCKGRSGTKEKRIWLRHLKKNNLKPNMITIQEYETPEELHEGESFWYGYFKMIGAELYNNPHYIGKGALKGANKGNKNCVGRYMSPKTRAKISASKMGKPSWNKGKKMSDESKKKLSNSCKGRIPWNKEKIGVQIGSFLGKNHTQESKNKMSECAKKRIRIRDQKGRFTKGE